MPALWQSNVTEQSHDHRKPRRWLGHSQQISRTAASIPRAREQAQTHHLSSSGSWNPSQTNTDGSEGLLGRENGDNPVSALPPHGSDCRISESVLSFPPFPKPTNKLGTLLLHLAVGLLPTTGGMLVRTLCAEVNPRHRLPFTAALLAGGKSSGSISFTTFLTFLCWLLTRETTNPRTESLLL